MNRGTTYPYYVKTTTPGGGVALAYRSSLCSFAKLSLTSMRGKKHEILVARGKIRGVKKDHIIVVAYLPPQYSVAESRDFMDVITDAITEARSKIPDAWVTVGGDWNARDLSPILSLFPDMDIVRSPPTRGSATLDIIILNYGQFLGQIDVNSPLETTDGKQSDHKVLSISAILPRPRAFAWEIHEYLKTSKEGDKKLVELIKNQDWNTVEQLKPNNHAMAVEFHRLIHEMMAKCYEWKRVRRRTTDKPWITDGLRSSIKKRAAVFRESGRSQKWKKIDKAIKKTLAYRKRVYNVKQKERLEKEGKRGQWWSISKYLGSDENPRQWSISDLDPDKSAEEMADYLADHFLTVTNQARPLEEGEIPRSESGEGNIRLLDRREVSQRLKKFKKPNSRVDGDLPKNIVNIAHQSLAIPLTLIYNTSFSNRSWPDIWKRETVVPIPKIPTPLTANDIRPISMTTPWSKVMESYIASFTLLETNDNWKNNQHGGKQGSCTDHVSIQLWDYILTDLDTSVNRVDTAVLCLSLIHI